MVNLDKLIGRIISDAEEYGRGLLESSEGDLAEIADSSRSKIEYVNAESASRAARDADAIISRAKASAESMSRDIILSAKAGLLDRTFDEAYKKLLELAGGGAEYVSFLTRLLVSVVSSAVKAEEENGEYYASGELVAYSDYVAAFCTRDLEGGERSVAASVTSAAAEKLSATGKALRVSDTAANIDGGFILRSGDIEYNCSLSALVAGYRSAHEAEIYRMLFKQS